MDYRFPDALPQRFTYKILVNELTGCWLWTGRRDKDGYGIFRVGNRVVRAHRWAYEQVHGVTLLPHQYVCHDCDTPGCVNPEHVFIGDAKANSDDMRRKGRGRGKLIAREVWQLRVALHRNGASVQELARLYRMPPSEMSDVLECRKYQHVPDPRRCPIGYVPHFDVSGRRLLRDYEAIRAS